MSNEKNVAIIQNIYAAFGRGDVPALLEHLADQVDWGIDTTAQTPWYKLWKTKATVPEFFMALNEHCEFTKFVPSNFAAAGDEVLATVSYDVRVKKNGKVVSQEALHRFTFKNGRVVAWRGFEDTHRVHEAWNG